MDKRTWVFIAIMVGLISGGLLYRHFAQDIDSRGATRLMRAIEENDAEKVLKFLSVEEVNARDKSGQTALFYAARNATDPKVIYKLIVAGTDPLTTDKSGQTALTTAAKYNSSPAIIMALAKQGSPAAQQQENKDKALVRAAKYNTAEIIKTLLIAHARPAGQQPNERNASVYLADNEKLTEQEKADYRQVMLMLEILDRREQFAKSVAGTQIKTTKKAENKNRPADAQKSVDQKETVKEIKTTGPSQEKTPATQVETGA